MSTARLGLAAFSDNLAALARRTTRSVSSGLLALRRDVLGQRFIERRIHDYRLLLDSHDPGVCRQLLERGDREPEQKLLLETALAPGMTAFDLGANVGYYTVMMARLVGSRGCVYAIEPLTQNFELLERNVRLNGLGNVWRDELAIAREDGYRDLLLTEKSNWHSFHAPHIAENLPWCEKYRRRIVGSVSVRTRSLQSYLAEKRSIDLMRMDIEGFETVILEAICDLPWAARSRMRILLETHPEFYSEANDMRRVLARLCHEHGYRPKYLISDYHFGSKPSDRTEIGAEVFSRRGYDARFIVRQFRNRAIYAGIGFEDAIDLISDSECVHAALLTPPDCR
jgi:FkbM family methyltransferase